MDEANVLYPWYIANCVLNAFLSYTAIMLNIVTIHAMRKTSSLPKPLKTLLLSLAVSDLGVGLVVQPYYIALMVKWVQNNTENNPVYTMETTPVIDVFYFASFLSILAISVDRFLAIHLHLRYQELVTHKRVVALVISIWVFSALISLFKILINIPSLRKVMAIIFGSYFIFTAVIYYKIYIVVRRHTNQIQALQLQQESQNDEMTNFARLRKSVVGTFYVYLVFLVCYIPGYCSLFIYIVDPQPNTAIEGFLLYVWTLIFLNSSLNPVVYCWKMRHIRHAIMVILRNIFPSQN